MSNTQISVCVPQDKDNYKANNIYIFFIVLKAYSH